MPSSRDPRDAKRSAPSGRATASSASSNISEDTMATNYTIYLVNQSSTTQTFWCFLTPPAELAGDPNVFANSSASLAIPSNYPGTNSFTIPVQYSVGAGASNQAVGLDVEINSTISQQSSLTQVWDATYGTVPPKMGPNLTLSSSKVGANSLKIVTNAFPQDNNESKGWYANQSFGIESASGFMGMTWSPSPSQSRTLTPKLSFYVSIGSFGDSTLADWTQVSNEAALLTVPNSFKAGAATVTLLNDGTWSVTPGKPASLTLLDNLSLVKSAAFQQLTALAYLSDGTLQQDVVKSVFWPTQLDGVELVDDGSGETILSGKMTVATALTAAFAFFVIASIKFTVNSIVGGTTVNFTYDGPQTATTIKETVVAGATAVFGKDA
ncbi:hypothetical protein [Sphingomonas sp. PAMC 26621]|uniref:hypothetical protein n=1 Tax=Sphingomonas sp. PAMC 26621 TaxID=1112213 RepID=UPI001EE664B3|nr:hypothetical protein [Sphingomonas sp. PAMC 26621]